MKISVGLIIMLTFNLINHVAYTHDKNNETKVNHEEVDKATKLSSGTESNNVIHVATIGMVCDFCAQAIEKVFMKRDEVQGIIVDLDNQKVVIYLKDNLSIEDTEIVKLFEDSGYSVENINRTI